MKIKLDENLPARLVHTLTRYGHEVDTVMEEGITGRDDTIVWENAQKAGCFLITQDLDFSDIRRFRPGTHRGILLVRLRVPGRSAPFRRIKSLFEVEDVESWEGCLVVVTEHKIRIRTPQTGTRSPDKE